MLAAVAGIFGEHGVSIQSMEQSGFGDEARLSFLTHSALTRDVDGDDRASSRSCESVDSDRARASA